MSSEKLPLDANIETNATELHSSVTPEQKNQVNALIENFSTMTPQDFQKACDQMVNEIGFEAFRNAVDHVITDKFEKRAQLARYQIADTTKKDAFSALNEYLIRNTYNTFAEQALEGAKISSKAILDTLKDTTIFYEKARQTINKVREEEIEDAKKEALEKIDEINEKALKEPVTNRVKKIVEIQNNLNQQIEKIRSKEYSVEDFARLEAIKSLDATGKFANYAGQSMDLATLSMKNDLLSETSVATRTVKLERYLQIAEVALKENNFSVAITIKSMLDSVPIGRLKATQDGLSKHAKGIMQNLSEKLTPIGSFKYVRSEVAANSSNSYLPPFLLVNDLDKTKEANTKTGVDQQTIDRFVQESQKVAVLHSPKGNDTYFRELNQNRIDYDKEAEKKRMEAMGNMDEEFEKSSISLEPRGQKVKSSPIMKAVGSIMHTSPQEVSLESQTENETPSKSLLIRNASTDSQLIDAIFAHLASAKEEYSFEEAKKESTDFIETMRNEILNNAPSEADKEYVTIFFNSLTNMVLEKISSSTNANELIKKEYNQFCESNGLGTNAERKDVEQAIQKKFDQAFVEQDFASKVQEESKKISKQILKDLKSTLDGKTSALISSISASEFIRDSSGSKIPASKIENLIKEGKIFTNKGELKEGYTLDPRSPIDGLGLSNLTPLEKYILSSLIINTALPYADEKRPEIDDNFDDPEVLANKELSALTQTHFCMLLNDRDSDKNNLLKEVRGFAEKIQKYDNSVAKQKTPNVGVLSSLQSGVKKLWNVVNPSSKEKKISSVDIPELQEKQTIRGRVTSIINPTKQKIEQANKELGNCYGQYFGAKNRLMLALGGVKEEGYTKEEMLKDMKKMQEAVEKLKVMQIPEEVTKQAHKYQFATDKIDNKKKLILNNYNECMRIINNQENPQSLFKEIKKQFNIELPSSQTTMENHIDSHNQPRRDSQPISPPPKWKTATHTLHTAEMDESIHGNKNQKLNQDVTHPMKDKLYDIEHDAKKNDELDTKKTDDSSTEGPH